MQCRSQSLSRVLRRSEAGYLCSSKEGWNLTMRTEHGKAQHISQAAFGHQEKIAFGHVHEEIEALIGHTIFWIGCKAVLHIVDEYIDYRFSISFRNIENIDEDSE